MQLLFRLFVWLLRVSARFSFRYSNPEVRMTIQDTFNAVVGQDATVVTDTAAVAAAQKTLDTDTATDVSAHAGLTAAVVAQGPTLVTATLANGTTEFVALLPQPDGTVANVVLFDGTTVPPAS